MEKENIFFADKKNGQGKYFEKENIFFCGREEKDEEKKKIFRKGKYVSFVEEKKNGEEQEKNGEGKLMVTSTDNQQGQYRAICLFEDSKT